MSYKELMLSGHAWGAGLGGDNGWSRPQHGGEQRSRMSGAPQQQQQQPQQQQQQQQQQGDPTNGGLHHPSKGLERSGSLDARRDGNGAMHMVRGLPHLLTARRPLCTSKMPGMSCLVSALADVHSRADLIQ